MKRLKVSEKRPSLLTTTAMRMALRYSLFYALILSVVFAVFLWQTRSSVDPEVASSLTTVRDQLVATYEQGGLPGLMSSLPKQRNASGILYLLVDKAGKNISGSMIHPPDDYEESDKVSYQLFAEGALPADQFEDEVYLPTLANELDDGYVLFISKASPQAYKLQEVADYLLEFTAAAILLSILIGLSLGYVILKRLNTISRTAAEIMQGDITRRIPVSKRNDEFDALSSQLNDMMDRIQKLIESIREVSDNVAHDLRSPLTRLRNNLEVTLLESRSNQEYRETLGQGVQDIEALLKTFNALLSIAQAESGNHRSSWQQVNINNLLKDMVELYEPLAEVRKQTLELQQNSKIIMTASRDLLAQAFSNLIENAIKYTPESGTIIITLDHDNEAIEVSVIDSGPGIPKAEYEHVLERFVRLDNSRNSPGNGLGLSLVKAVSELHRGSLHFNDVAPGLKVTMRFPYPI